jgi:hypothetical protein
VEFRAPLIATSSLALPRKAMSKSVSDKGSVKRSGGAYQPHQDWGTQLRDERCYVVGGKCSGQH